MKQGVRAAFAILALWLSVGMAHASVEVDWVENARRDNPDQVPSGAECATLVSTSQSIYGEGTVEDLDSGGLLAKLLCPKCTRYLAYAVDEPLQGIDREIRKELHDPDFQCGTDCPHWVLKVSPKAALLFVHVGTPSRCGATGWCEGRIYERSQGAWTQIDTYASNEDVQLCAFHHPQDGALRLWLTSVGNRPRYTMQLDWRPAEQRAY